MEAPWLHLSWAVTAYLFALIFSFALLRTGSLARRRCLALGVQLLVGTIPFWLPEQEVQFRFFLSLASVLSIVRIWETSERLSAHAGAPSRFSHFAVFFTSVSDLRFHSDPGDRESTRRLGVARLLRSTLKLSSLAALFSLHGLWQGLLDVPVAAPTWCLLSAYCAATGMSDVLTGLTMLVTGHRAAEVFRSPLVSRSPIEFWSQRWNLMFRNSAFRLVFLPLGGRRHPLLSTAAVFALSAAVHEYIVLASLEQSGGQMALFFGVHGCATLLNLWLRRRFAARPPLALGIALNWAWMVLTAPLFFAPILDLAGQRTAYVVGSRRMARATLCVLALPVVLLACQRAQPVQRGNDGTEADNATAAPAATVAYTAELMVEGVSCASCTVAIRQRLRGLEGVLDIREGKSKQHILVDFDDQRVSAERILEAVHEAGYDAEVLIHSKKT